MFFDHASSWISEAKVHNLSDNHFGLGFAVMKYWPANYILMRAIDRQEITTKTKVIETSSGTMALGLAHVCRHLGMDLTIVTDTAVDPTLKLHMEMLGTTVDMIQTPVERSNVQQLRMNRLAEHLCNSEDSFHPNQYDNPDNIESYGRVAALLAEAIPEIDILVAPVGSGGSSAGLSSYLREFNPNLKLIGVDTFGSAIFGQNIAKRALRGLGNSLIPQNVRHTAFDEVHWVDERISTNGCHRLLRQHGLFMGPTSGASFSVSEWIAKMCPDQIVVSVFPDSGHRYASTIYNPTWLKNQHSLKSEIPPDPMSVSSPTNSLQGWEKMSWDRRTLNRVVGHANETFQ